MPLRMNDRAKRFREFSMDSAFHGLRERRILEKFELWNNKKNYFSSIDLDMIDTISSRYFDYIPPR